MREPGSPTTEPDGPMAPDPEAPSRLGAGLAGTTDPADSTDPGSSAGPGPPPVGVHPASSAFVRVALGRRDLLAGLTMALALVVLGVPVGLLWGATSPRALAVQAVGGARLVEPEGEAFIAADGRFLLLTALAGLVCGMSACWLGRRHPEAVVLGLAVGGLAAAVVAWRTGHQLHLDDYRQALRSIEPGQRFRAAVDIRAKGVLVGWPVAALSTYVALSLSTERDQP